MVLSTIGEVSNRMISEDRWYNNLSKDKGMPYKGPDERECEIEDYILQVARTYVAYTKFKVAMHIGLAVFITWVVTMNMVR